MVSKTKEAGPDQEWDRTSHGQPGSGNLGGEQKSLRGSVFTAGFSKTLKVITAEMLPEGLGL